MEGTITSRFLSSIYDFSRNNIPDSAYKELKYSLADYVSCAYAGASFLNEKLRIYIDEFSDVNGNVPAIGFDRRVNLLVAAMANGVSSHQVELDDGQRFAMLHLAAPVISALLSVAYDRGLNFQEFAKGVVVGYEATIRLACAIQPGHKLKGYHATGTCGTMGAALGICAALGYDFDRWNAVLSAAATDAAGLLQVIDDGSELKPYNVGRAAVAAINAAYFGMTGLRGPGDILGGKRGFFRAGADEVNEEVLLKGFLPQYGIETIYRKPYAACRHCHAAIEAVLKIHEENPIDADAIEEVQVLTYSLAVNGHDHIEVENAGSAKMSIPYAVAAALIYGRVNVQQYDESCLNNERLLELMGKVTVSEDEQLSAIAPGKRAAIVKIKTKGQIFEKRVDYPLGEPENRMTVPQLQVKYYSLMESAGCDESYSTKLLDTINNLDSKYVDFLKLLS